MKRKTAILAAMATALNLTAFTVPQTVQAATSIKAEFEDGTFYDCQYNEGLTWTQIDEDAEKNPCDMTGWSGDGYAYIDDKDSSVAVKVNAPADGFYALKISYIQCLGIPHKIQYLYVNGESQGEINFTYNSGKGWELLDAGYVHLNKGENEIKIVSYWGYTFLDYLLIEDAPAYISDLSGNRKLCNPNASKAAQNVFDYLCKMYGNHIISGQQEYCGSHCYNKNAYEVNGQPIDYFEDNEAEFEYLQENTGKQPAIRGIDFLFYNTTAPYMDDAPERAIAWYKEKGGIPTVSFHWNVPTEKGSSTTAFYVESTGNTPFTTFSISNALKEGTWENEVLMKDLDLLGEQFKKLADEDVPVIFRPLHEAEGAWFWWGAEGPEPCKQLYALMQDTLIKKYGCNNIIWEWTSNPYASSLEWYPGDDRVDLVSCDKYNAINNSIPNESAVSATFYSLVGFTEGEKMVAMSENDTIPSLTNLLEAKAGWLYFCPWYMTYLTQLNNKDTLKELYNSDYCITLDELPDWSSYQADAPVTPPAVTTTTMKQQPAVTTTTKTASKVSLLGDVNCDGKVQISDVVLFSRYINEEPVKVSDVGLANADCDFNKMTTMDDATRILLYIARLISEEAFLSGK